MIPIVGAYLGGAPAVLIALADSPTQALVVLIFFVAWQQVRDYVVSPSCCGPASNCLPPP